MPEIVLDLAHILAAVGECKAAAMTKHMRVQVRQVATLAARCIIRLKPSAVIGAPRSVTKMNWNTGAFAPFCVCT